MVPPSTHLCTCAGWAGAPPRCESTSQRAKPLWRHRPSVYRDVQASVAAGEMLTREGSATPPEEHFDICSVLDCEDEETDRIPEQEVQRARRCWNTLWFFFAFSWCLVILNNFSSVCWLFVFLPQCHEAGKKQHKKPWKIRAGAWRLSSTPLEEQWVTQEIKRAIKNFLRVNEGDITQIQDTHTQGTAKRH